MKVFAIIVLCLMILSFIVLPGIDEYNKHKNGTKKKAITAALMPLLLYIGLGIAGFIIYEIIPRIIENMFF